MCYGMVVLCIGTQVVNSLLSSLVPLIDHSQNNISNQGISMALYGMRNMTNSTYSIPYSSTVCNDGKYGDVGVGQLKLNVVLDVLCDKMNAMDGRLASHTISNCLYGLRYCSCEIRCSYDVYTIHCSAMY